MDATKRFGRFEISCGVDGQGIELKRSPDELVFLAFDTRIKRLVELHIVNKGSRLQTAEKESVYERAALTTSLRRRSFIRMLHCAEDDGVVFYTSSLNDGESLESYIGRRGPLPPPTAFSLTLQLLDDLAALQSCPALFEDVRLEHLYITLLEDTFLQFFVSDYGLVKRKGAVKEGEDATAAEGVEQRLVREICLVLFHLLTGKAFAGDDPDRFPVLTALPSGLRTILRTSLTNPANTPASLARMRDAARDALMAQTRDLQGRNSRRHLVAAEDMLPKSDLADVLVADVPVSQLLKSGLLLEGDAQQRRYPFTLRAVDSRTETPVMVHLLPPRRIISPEQYDAVPLQMWRFTDAKHPHIMRSRSVWESPDLTFLTEELRPGFPLSRLISERVYLNPSEVLILIRQVRRGIEEAVECGVDKLDLHPSNITLRLHQAPHAREQGKLMQKRLDAWPKFLVLLRPHMTMRSLYEPMMVDAAEENWEDEAAEATENRNRSFVALTAYLLSGEAQFGNGFWMPDSVPEELAKYIRECLDAGPARIGTPGPAAFLAGFEMRAAIPEMEADSEADPYAPVEGAAATAPAQTTSSRRPPVVIASAPVISPAALAEMESAGSVSDFDDDEDAPGYTPFEPGKEWPAAVEAKSFSSQKGGSWKPGKGRFSMAVWAGVAALVMALLVFLFAGRSKGSAAVATAPAPAAVPVLEAPKTKETPPPVEKPKPPRQAPAPAFKPAPPAVTSVTPKAADSPAPAAPAPDGGGKQLTPEEIRRALLLSEAEKREVLKEQNEAREGAALTLANPDEPAGN